MLLFAVSLRAEEAKRPAIGSSQESLIEELGKPRSEMKAGQLRVLVYDGFSVKLIDGKVVSYEAAADYATKAVKPANRPPAKKAYSNHRPVVEIRNKGQAQDIRELLVADQVTVVDFFADWCGPCKQMDPKLQQLAHNDSGVFLRKVDIVDWQSPIVKQIGIRFVPYVAVFDGRGQLVGKPSSDIGEIEANVAKAKAATRS